MTGSPSSCSSIGLEVIETPGHTMTHICLLGSDENGPFLLAGDTLFGAGVGNCNFGGHAPTLFQTVSRLRTLDLDTRIYPGHDYLRRNLEFAGTLEPQNEAIHALRSAIKTISEPRFTRLSEELAINPFMRLDSAAISESLATSESAPRGAEEIFLEIRRLRDAW